MTQRSTTSFHTDWLPSALFGVYSMLTGVAVFWLPIYLQDELGFSGSEIGLVFAVLAVAGTIAAVPAGFSNDRITSRTMVIAALTMQGATLFLFGSVSTFWTFLAVYFVWAIAFNVMRISMEMQVLKHDTGENTARRIGLFVSWRFGGLALGMVLAAVLFQTLDFRLTFKVVAVACLALLLPALLLPPTKVSRHTVRAYLGDLKSLKVLLFVGWMMLFTTHWGAEQTCYSLFLRHNLGLSLTGIGFYMGVEFATIIAAAALFGPRLARPNSRLVTTVLLGLFLSGVGHLGMVVDNVWVSVAFRIIHGFGDGAIMIVLYLGVTRLFAVERLGGNAGVINLAMTTGAIAGALIAGPVGEKFGYEVPFFASGIVLLLLMIPVATRLRPRARR
jgi:MFS family permease